MPVNKCECGYTLFNQYPAKCREDNALSRPVASQVWCITRLAKRPMSLITSPNSSVINLICSLFIYLYLWKTYGLEYMVLSFSPSGNYSGLSP